MKKLILLATLFIVGCATYTGINTHQTASGERLAITGKYNDLTKKMTITINGTPYEGHLSLWNRSGGYQFEHDGMPGYVECQQEGFVIVDLHCAVNINNERAATFIF